MLKIIFLVIVDKAYEAGKWCVSGVTSAFSSMTNYFIWGNVNNIEKEFNEKEVIYTEFEVIQINWYWRRNYFLYFKILIILIY